MKLTEKELIGKLQELRQIKPGKDWAVSTKTQILGEIPGFFPFPFFAPALAGLIFIFVASGFFSFAQNSVPGDSLYALKKVVEKSQAVFISEQEKPEFNLNLVNKRLEELAKIAEDNKTRNMASAINEVRESVSKANKDLSDPKTVSLNPVAIKGIVDGIEEKVQMISTFGVVVGGEEEFDELRQGSNKRYVEYLISDLKERALTDYQEEILGEMEELVGKGEYSEALELFLAKFNQATEEDEPQEQEGEEEETEEEQKSGKENTDTIEEEETELEE